MILRTIPLLGTLLLVCFDSSAQLRRVPEETTSMFFGGGTRQVRTIWENPAARTVEISLSTRVFQASSATAVSTGGVRPWKKLTLLAGQTILETTPIEFPEVKAE